MSFEGLKRMSVFGSSEKPSRGALLALISLPLASTRLTVWLFTEPAANATSGSERTFASTVSGNVGASIWLPLPPFENAALPLMITSAFLYCVLKIVLKPLLIVSVRT